MLSLLTVKYATDKRTDKYATCEFKTKTLLFAKGLTYLETEYLLYDR